MNKVEHLDKARALEFWDKHLQKISQGESVFSGGTNLKNEDIVTVGKTDLNKSDLEKVFGLCNSSDVLIYNFYSNVLSVLFFQYKENVAFLSPLNQFDHVSDKTTVFFIQPAIDSKDNFKNLFSSQKVLLLEAAEQSLEWNVLNDFLGPKGLLDKVTRYGLIIGNAVDEEQEEISAAVKILFIFVLDGDRPYLKVRIKGEMYDPGLVTIFCDNFNCLLNQIISRIYDPLGDLSYRGPLETSILADMSRVEPYFPLDENIVDLVDLVCQGKEGNIAIYHNGQQITYGDLFKYTNRLSRFISKTFEPKRDDLIGVMLPRSVNMIKAILAIWKSGAAYVPIATSIPDDGLLQIIENSALKAIITDNKEILAQLARMEMDIPVVNLNEIGEELDQYSDRLVENGIHSSDLAYVIYTSGSTGLPKGVMIEHIGMCNHIGAKITEINIGHTSIVAQNAPHTFDISVWQMFAPLVVGGRVIIYDADLLTDVKGFVSGISKDKVSVLELVPSYLLEMLHYLENDLEKTELTLKTVILNAETLTKTTVKRWQSLYPSIPIVNTYGATEVSDDMAHYFIGRTLETYSVPVMRKPIQHFEVYIVDENKKILPIGVPGEILLAGPCVGRGYINNDKKTKEAFLAGPLEGFPSRNRIYNTGDSGRLLSDGTMEFLGRNDNQVKILGQRIELDAIENIASAIDGIKSCKAIAYMERQLIALYYVSDGQCDKYRIEKWLLRKLPGYMLPSVYISMEGFPLTENGKIDVRSFPDPQTFGYLSEDESATPKNETEATLMSVWKKILDVEKVTARSNFFELGGHSLKLMRLKNEYFRLFNTKIEIKVFFENPTLQQHAKLIIDSEKSEYEQIRGVEDAENYAISDAQKRLWILSQFEGGSVVYNMPSVIKMRTDIRLDILKTSVKAVIERHEILRTVFKENPEGEVRQWVLKSKEQYLNIQYLDLVDSEDQQVKVEDYVNQDVLEPFDLENGPLFRAALFKIGEREYVFYYNIHHLISDGWSTEVLFHDIQAYYEAFEQGKPPGISPLRIQYKDYTAWQFEQLMQPSFEEHKKYWLEQFAGTIPVLDLPIALKRPIIKTNNGSNLGIYLSEDLSEALKNFCRQNGGSLFMGLLASLNALFSRYTDQEEFVIGSPVSGRDHKELENQIGFYANTLAFKNQVRADDTFRSVFLRVKYNTLEAHQHRQYPFDRLIEDLELTRDMSRNLLFDIMLVLQNEQSKETPTPGTTDNIMDYGVEMSKFDLLFTFREMGKIIGLSVNYNTDIFPKEAVERLIRHFRQMLSAMLQYQDREIGKLGYLSEKEEQQLLYQFNDTRVIYPADLTMLDFFKLSVNQFPESIALVYENIRLTYRELDEKSNQLAHYLASKGVSQEELIPICLDRSLEMVIAILAIMKCGGAYVPIDTGCPKERINYMVSDTGAKFVLSVSAYKDLFQTCDLIDLADFRYNSHSAAPLSINVSPGNLAYCIYTSGTTGKPKGVLNQHSGILNRLLWMRDSLHIDREDVLLQKTPYVFDVSLWELAMPFITGCKLVIAVPGGHSDPEYLQDIIAREKVTMIHFVPSMLGAFLEVADKTRVPSIRHVVCSGEALTSAIVVKFKQVLPDIGIHNFYGPTEAAIEVTSIDLIEVDTSRVGVGIGKPVPNTRIYIVDKEMNIQPVGVTGELLIGGIQVSRGYLNKPELTKEKFVQDVFTNDGYLLYRTSDLARWQPDGNIEFLGRRDDQVKIRGHRIELEEIEHYLRLKNDITDVAVAAREMRTGNKELVAYIVSGKKENSADLRTYLSELLPDYMIPWYFLHIEHIPVNQNGKVDKKALPDPESLILSAGIIYEAPENEVEQRLAQIWSGILGRGQEEIGVDAGFFTIGGNSLRIIKLRSEILHWFNRKLPLVSLFQNPTIKSQAKIILAGNDVVQTPDVISNSLTGPARENYNMDVAVIGMSIQTPGTEDVGAFWNILREGLETIRHFSEEELREDGVPEQLLENKKYIRSGGYLEGKENFDAAFFGYLPGEAKSMDPQTRMFHEIVWSAIEDAGYDPLTYAAPIGLYAGARANIKWQAHCIINRQEYDDAFSSDYFSDKDFAHSLIAHRLNLKGSVNSINTACSTSLVAVHNAVRSLQSGENYMAVAGGITLRSNLKEGYLYQEGMIYSRDGHNRAFDQLSSGTVSGEGAGAVVLKLLDKALEDGDNILAVIKGSAVNNDGNRKVGFTAPSIDGQAEVIRMAQKAAGVEPGTIAFIEAHGTATKLGDPIEIEALTQVFGNSDHKYCAVGTVKSNIGHLDIAAGIAGFIKTVLCLKNRKLVPSLHFNTPNPEIDFERGPFYVNTEYKDWKPDRGPLRAGISSFGIGGTNAHIILEEAPQLPDASLNERLHLILLSARTREALERQQVRLKKFLLQNNGTNIADIAWTLQTRRAKWAYRSSFVAGSIESAIDVLGDTRYLSTQENAVKPGKKELVFMFPGQGSQYANMGKELYESEAVFRATMDFCFVIAKGISGIEYKSILYPVDDNMDELINQTKYTQPIIFIFEYALAKQLEDYGLRPDKMIGHSIGEYVSACLSGVITLENALKLIIRRAELIQALPGGTMISVGSPAKRLLQYLPEAISIAAVNTPESCVLSGEDTAIMTFCETLKHKGIPFKKLHTSHAFHSEMMAPVEEEFAEFVSAMEISAPRIPYISNVTGEEVSLNDIKTGKYWSDHIRKTVRFSEGLEAILSNENIILLEVGPGKALSDLARQQKKARTTFRVFHFMKHPKDTIPDGLHWLTVLGKLWVCGVEIDWAQLHKGEKRRTVSLPAYPFERVPYPLGEDVYKLIYEGLSTFQGSKRQDPSNWLYEPVWKRIRPAGSTGGRPEGGSMLLFMDNLGIGMALVDRLKKEGSNVIRIYPGESYARLAEDLYQLNMGEQDDYYELFRDLAEQKMLPRKIIHLFNIQHPEDTSPGKVTRDNFCKDSGFYSVLYLARGLNKLPDHKPMDLYMITNDLQSVLGTERGNPMNSLTLGLLNVISQESPSVRSKGIDITLVGDMTQTGNDLFQEINTGDSEKFIAYRFNNRWAKGYNALVTKETERSDELSKNLKIKQGGVYLITGGLGNLGFEYAKWLLAEHAASLILTGRSEISIHSDHHSVPGEAPGDSRLRYLQELGNVIYCQANAADFKEMQQAVEAGRVRFGKIDGVIHAAGIIAGNSIRGINFLKKEDCERQFEPKVGGVGVIAELFKGQELGFCLFVSSLSSVLGGKEFASYAAANTYLDYVSQMGMIKNSISINYDGLNFTDQKTDTALNPSEMTGILERALASGIPQIVVSVTDLHRRIDEWTKQPVVIMEPDRPAEIYGRVAEIDRAVLTTAYVAPQSPTELKLNQLLEEFFMLKGIGINDDFFELGGDSLKAMTLANHIYRLFDVELSLKYFYGNATIEALAKEIDLAIAFQNIKEMNAGGKFENETII